MDHDQLFSWFHDLVPNIKSAETAEDTFVEFARDRNMAPALLEKLGHMYNVSLTLHAREKNASEGLEFRKLDVPGILERYTEYTPTTAKAAVRIQDESEHVHTDFPVGRLAYIDDTPSTLKVAAEETSPEPTWRETIRDLDHTESWLATAREYREDVRNELKQACERAFDELLQRYPDGVDAFPVMEADAVACDGTLKSACDTLEQYMNANTYRVKRAEDSTFKRLVVRQNTCAPVLEAIKQADVTLDTVNAMIKDAEGRATDLRRRGRPEIVPQMSFPGYEGTRVLGVAPPSPRAESKKKEDSKPEKSEKPESVDVPKGPGGVMQWLLSRESDFPLMTGPNVMERANPFITEALKRDYTEAQKAMDTAFDDAKAQAVLETIIATDPVVGTADPETVVSFAQTILSTDPAAARDYNVMRFALREALAQMGIDPQMRDMMLKGRKARAEADKEETEQRKAQYSQPSGTAPWE